MDIHRLNCQQRMLTQLQPASKNGNTCLSMQAGTSSRRHSCCTPFHTVLARPSLTWSPAVRCACPAATFHSKDKQPSTYTNTQGGSQQACMMYALSLLTHLGPIANLPATTVFLQLLFTTALCPILGGPLTTPVACAAATCQSKIRTKPHTPWVHCQTH